MNHIIYLIVMQVVENKTRLKLTINPEQFIRQIETLVSKFKGRVTNRINRNDGGFEIQITFPESMVTIEIVCHREKGYLFSIKKQGHSRTMEEFIKELVSVKSSEDDI